jgi:diguanylate cyclase (GGDEF)-like protein
MGPNTAALAMDSPPPRAEFEARVRLASEVGRLRRARARSSILDGMTRLYNRGYLLSRLEQEFSRARRHHTALSFVLFDIDQLRIVNDQFGQRLGDLAVFDVGQVLRARVRRSDVFGRYGEDVFGVILPDSGVRGAAVFANTVRTDVEERWLPPGGRKVQVRLSAGIATFFGGSEIHRGEQLVFAAELALREAKRRGGNRVFIHEDSLRSSCQHILIADPDPTMLGLAEDLLSMEDYQITAASTPEGVLAAARSERPNLLIIDLQLAQAQPGPSIIERVRALEPDSPLPVIVMSAADGGELEHLSRLGVDRYVTKPFSVSVLRSIARELFRAYQFEAANSD